MNRYTALLRTYLLKNPLAFKCIPVTSHNRKIIIINTPGYINKIGKWFIFFMVYKRVELCYIIMVHL
jgi:hypothetical protein